MPAHARADASIAVVGAGNWGTTLAVMQASADRSVTLCTRDEDRARDLRTRHENVASLPGVRLPEALRVHGSYAAAAEAQIIVIAVPSEHMRATCRALAPALDRSHLVTSATKGLETGTGFRQSEIIAQELPEIASQLCVLSGPNLAGEINAGLPAAAVLASTSHATAVACATALATRLFRLYTSDDVTGVELGGSLKNVVALAAGICDGLEMGINGKAAIVTRGMAEIVRLGRACGANPLTFAGLSGYGDLFATCVSPLSRNHFVGLQLGRGLSLSTILSGMTMVAEGVHTTQAASDLAARLRVDLPITEQVRQVLFEAKDPREAVHDLLSRLARDEQTGELL